jgi:hypothetical protein
MTDDGDEDHHYFSKSNWWITLLTSHTNTATKRPFNFWQGRRWACLLLLLLMVTLWPTIVQCSIAITGGFDNDDDKNNNNYNLDEDQNVVATDTEYSQQHNHYYRPYSLNLGVPQNLNDLYNNEMDEEENKDEDDDDDDDDDVSPGSTNRHSRKEMEEYMETTEEYFRTEVLNVLKPEQVERCKDYHESCVIWRLV